MNKFIIDRINGIRDQLMAGFRSCSSLSSATKGSEREMFVNIFLSQVFPSPFRFGSGDATDEKGNRTGQLDIVVEYPFLPSLPSPGFSRYRLYLAEGVAAVIEVKSNVEGQWSEAEATASKVHALQRNLDRFSRRMFGGTVVKNSSNVTMTNMMLSSPITISSSGISVGDESLIPDRIPVFAVGYTGWKTLAPLEDRVRRDGRIDGILVLESGLFVGGPRVGNITKEGPESLWAFISSIHKSTRILDYVDLDPMSYLTPEVDRK